MTKKQSFWQRYRKLSLWGKVAFWGSVGSLISLPLGIISVVLSVLSLGGTPALTTALTDPLAIILLLLGLGGTGYLIYRSVRLVLFVRGLKNVPDAQQALLLKAEYGPQPDSITPDDQRKAYRDWYIFLFAILLVVAVLVGLGLYLRHLAKADDAERHRREAERLTLEVARQRADADGLRRKIDQIEGKLDVMVDREKRLLIISASVGGQAAVLAHQFPSPEVRELAENLKGLVKEYEKVVDKASMTEDDNLRLRVAKAKVANVENRYEDALRLVTATDAETERKKTDTQIKREYEVVQVRAESFDGLHEWEQALRSYNRMVDLRPKEYGARSGRARCLYSLGRLKESLIVWDELLADLTKQYEHGSSQLGADIAVCFANRAGVLAELGSLKAALTEATVAIDMLRKVLAKEGAPLRVPLDLARTLVRRAGLHADLRHYEASLKDYQSAFELVEQLDQKGWLGEVNTQLPQMLHNRATVLFEHGKEDAAFEDINKSIELQTAIAKRPGYEFVSRELAISLIARAAMLSVKRRDSASIADLDRAISLLKVPVAKGDRDDLAFHLAHAFRLKAIVLADKGELIKSAEDLQTALNILSPIVKHTNQPVVVCEIANIWREYADRLLQLSRRAQKERERLIMRAGDDLTQAVLVFRKLIESSSLIQYKGGLALALYARSGILYQLHRHEEAARDGEEAYTLLKSLAKESGWTDHRLRFAKCAIDIGFGMAESGQAQNGINKMNEGIQIQRDLVRQGEKWVQIDLASALQLRGRVFGNNQEREKAKRDLDESVRLFKHLIDLEGRKELQPHLDRSMRHCRELAEGKPLRDLP